MRSFKILFVLIGLLLVSQVAFAQADTTGIRAIWNQEIFVVINTSTEDVNVSNLSFTSVNGEILPENWVMDTVGENNVPYSLAELEPGSCLLAFLSGTAPDVPGTVTCTRVAGEFTVTNFGDIVWDVTQGGFSAAVDGQAVSECDINRTACDVSVSTTAANPADATMMMGDGDTADIRVIWNRDILVLINTSTEDVNVSNLTFNSVDGAILPENWVMDTVGDDNIPYSLAEFEPGSCLLAYLSGTSPDVPETVACTRIVGEFTLTNAADIVWDAAQRGFTANATGASVAECDITGSACDITVATTTANPMDATEGGAAGVDVRAIWDRDILVLINVSTEDVDLTSLSFDSANGEILPENWVMSTFGDDNVSYSLAAVEPGSCLLAYLSGTSPDVPETVECTRVAGEFTLTNAADIVWDVTQGGFSAVLGGSIAAECDITRSRCDIPLLIGE